MALLSRSLPPSEFDDLAYRLLRLGLWVNVAAPVGACVTAYVIRESLGGKPLGGMDSDLVRVIFYVFLALSFAEIGMMWFLRRSLLNAKAAPKNTAERRAFDQWVSRGTIVLFAIGATPAIYGAVFHLVFGGTERELVLFGLITLVAFRVFRPSSRSLADLYQSIADPNPIKEPDFSS